MPPQVGKTTLMVKYVENRLDEDYIQTLARAPRGNGHQCCQ